MKGSEGAPGYLHRVSGVTCISVPREHLGRRTRCCGYSVSGEIVCWAGLQKAAHIVIEQD